MNFAPYQWRADEGYLPPPGSMPAPLYPSPPYWAAATAPQIVYPQYSYPAGPVVAVPPPPPPAKSKKPTPPSPPKLHKTIATLPSVAPGESCSGHSPSKKPKPPPTIAHSTNEMAPPSLRPAVNYMYSREHTMLHIFNKASKVWEDKYKKVNLSFKIFKVATTFTVKNVIERVLKTDDKEKLKGWAATEVVEVGEGSWRKGTTIEYDGDKSAGTLASMGWDGKRGKAGALPPVWITVHKV